MTFYVLLGIIFVLLIVIDQIIKYYTVLNLMPLDTIPVIKNVLSFTYVENYGAAFGILQNAKVFFIIITVIITAAFIIYTVKSKVYSKLYLFSVCLILAGAFGNLTDRITKGYVVDMIQVKFIDFPVFNFADCCVVTGAILLCVYVLFFQTDKKEDSVI